MQKKDIQDLDDVKRLVNTFYEQVREDSLIGPIFNTKIGENWPEHLEKMYRFWQTILLSEHTYYGSPFPPHVKLPVEKEHFDRWLNLFSETLKKLFSGEKADEALWRATKMAEMFHYKIEYYKKSSAKPLQ